MTDQEIKEETFLLEKQKVAALVSISKSLGILSTLISEIDRKEWGERIEYYLAEWYKTIEKKPEKGVL
jgi:uncharacterized OB-fold protein